MPNKKVCKQYPNDQYGPCAPDISGKWDVYFSAIILDDGKPTTFNQSPPQINVIQDNLYFNFSSTGGNTRIGMLYPVGKCWEAKSVDIRDNGTFTYRIIEIKCGKVTRMIATYTEAGNQPGNPDQRPGIFVANWYRAD